MPEKQNKKEHLDEKIKKISNSIKDLQLEPYWIFQSPCPSSTESAVLKRLKNAHQLLEEAAILAKSLY